MQALLGRRSHIRAWIYLAAAIIAEVIGTSFLAQAVREDGYIGYIIMAIALAVSYYFLSLSVRQISVGIAYAVWEGLGLILLSVIGVLFFKEVLSVQEIVGLMLAVIGVTCVTMGEGEDEEQESIKQV